MSSVEVEEGRGAGAAGPSRFFVGAWWWVVWSSSLCDT